MAKVLSAVTLDRREMTLQKKTGVSLKNLKAQLAQQKRF